MPDPRFLLQGNKCGYLASTAQLEPCGIPTAIATVKGLQNCALCDDKLALVHTMTTKSMIISQGYVTQSKGSGTPPLNVFKAPTITNIMQD